MPSCSIPPCLRSSVANVPCTVRLSKRKREQSPFIRCLRCGPTPLSLDERSGDRYRTGPWYDQADKCIPGRAVCAYRLDWPSSSDEVPINKGRLPQEGARAHVVLKGARLWLGYANAYLQRRDKGNHPSVLPICKDIRPLCCREDQGRLQAMCSPRRQGLRALLDVGAYDVGGTRCL